MSTRYTYTWRCEVRDQHDVDPQLQNLPIIFSRDLFNVRVSISIKLLPTNVELPILTPFPPFVSSLLGSYQDLLGDCPRFMRNNLPPIVSDECVFPLALEVKSLAEQVVVRRLYETNKVPRLLPLSVNINIDFDYDHERDEDTIVNWIIQQSMQEAEVRMVPASEEAVSSSLKKVKFQTNVYETKRCNVCLEEFDDAEDVSEMPCRHIYHHECIIQWLKTSHVCPICRYQLPTEPDP